jgi:hypothetical protein
MVPVAVVSVIVVMPVGVITIIYMPVVWTPRIPVMRTVTPVP